MLSCNYRRLWEICKYFIISVRHYNSWFWWFFILPRRLHIYFTPL